MASDDPHAADEVREALKPDSTVRVIAQQAAALGSNKSKVLRTRIERRLNRLSRDSPLLWEATAEVLADMDMLADASALVGPFTSQVFRLAFELSYFRKSRVVPFESVDTSWCWGGYAPVQVSDGQGRKWTYNC